MLKKDAKRVHDDILARNDDKLQEYLATQFPDKEGATVRGKKHKFKFSRKLGFAVASFVVVIVSLAVSLKFLLPKKDSNTGNEPTDNGKHEYYENNEVKIASTLNALNGETQFVKVNLLEEKTNTVLVYDSPSKEYLYFYLIYDAIDSFESAYISVVVNEYYTESFLNIPDPLTARINGFEVKYSEKIELDDDLGIYTVTSEAIILTGKERIYVTYEAYSLDESSDFLDWLGQTIKKK